MADKTKQVRKEFYKDVKKDKLRRTGKSDVKPGSKEEYAQQDTKKGIPLSIRKEASKTCKRTTGGRGTKEYEICMTKEMTKGAGTKTADKLEGQYWKKFYSSPKKRSK